MLAQSGRSASRLHRVFAVHKETAARVLETTYLRVFQLHEKPSFGQVRRLDHLLWALHQTDDQTPAQETLLVVNFLQFVGAGWHTTGDAMLANTAAAKAREQRRTAREELSTAWAN